MRENARFARALPEGAIVLDAGAGDQPYRKLFSHCRYEAADFEIVDKPYGETTYVGDLAAIHVEDERFDAILFNQVMEHLPDPRKVLVELKRVLKPGGMMMCTAPLFYEEHERPYDFYRYTQFGWHHLMREAGLEVVRLDWMEGYFGTVAYQLETASRCLPMRPRQIAPGLIGFLATPLMLACKAMFRLLAWLFYALDERIRYTANGYPKNYVVLVRKHASIGTEAICYSAQNGRNR